MSGDKKLTSVYFTEQELQLIDNVRGTMPRSVFISYAVSKEVTKREGVTGEIKN